MRGARPPLGFAVERDAEALNVVEPGFAAEARELGLLAPDGIERALALGRRLESGRGAAVIVSCGAREVVVRELRHGGALGALLGSAHWGAARLLGELAATHALHARGAPVPRPLLALARRIRGPLWRCALGTQRLPGETLLAALRAAADPATRERALAAAAVAARALHELGCRHHDLNASNVLVAERCGYASGAIVDLDRARIGARVPAARRAYELARLARSLAKHGGAARFGAGELETLVVAYCAGDQPLERALRGRLRWERARTALHAWRYARR